MSEVLSRLYTAVDSIISFLSWAYESGQLLVDYIAEKFDVIYQVCSAIPVSWAVAFAAMAACALIYLALGR